MWPRGLAESNGRGQGVGPSVSLVPSIPKVPWHVSHEVGVGLGSLCVALPPSGLRPDLRGLSKVAGESTSPVLGQPEPGCAWGSQGAGDQGQSSASGPQNLLSLFCSDVPARIHVALGSLPCPASSVQTSSTGTLGHLWNMGQRAPSGGQDGQKFRRGRRKSGRALRKLRIGGKPYQVTGRKEIGLQG